MAESTSRPCSSVPSRNGLWPSAVHSGEIREFISCSCAGSNGFCTASTEAKIASRKNRAVMTAAIIVMREREKEYKMSLSNARRTQPVPRLALAAASAGRGTAASVMRGSRSMRATDGRAQARIDDGVEDQRNHQQIGRHDRDIDALHSLHEHQPHAGPLEYGLGDDRKRNNRAKLQACHGDDGNQRVL